MSDIAGSTKFKVTNTKLFVPIVTLATRNNVKLNKQLNDGFERSLLESVHDWNEIKQFK